MEVPRAHRPTGLERQCVRLHKAVSDPIPDAVGNVPNHSRHRYGVDPVVEEPGGSERRAFAVLDRHRLTGRRLAKG